jgi:hypothetical protein
MFALFSVGEVVRRSFIDTFLGLTKEDNWMSWH